MAKKSRPEEMVARQKTPYKRERVPEAELPWTIIGDDVVGSQQQNVIFSAETPQLSPQ